MLTQITFFPMAQGSSFHKGNILSVYRRYTELTLCANTDCGLEIADPYLFFRPAYMFKVAVLFFHSKCTTFVFHCSDLSSPRILQEMLLWAIIKHEA